VDTESATYNALGERVETHAGSAYHEFVYDPAGVEVGRSDRGSSFFWQYVMLGEQPFGKYQDGKTYFLHGTHLGSTSFVTDQTGAVIQDVLNYPWGTQWSQTGTNKDQHYNGMWQDPESGLDHTEFRKYYPNLGRWLSPDAVGGDIMNPQSLNRYTYALNNPATLNDPSGLDPMCDGRIGSWITDASCSWDESGGGGGGYGGGYGGYGGGGIYGGGGGVYAGGSSPSAPGAPPAGQPPLAGGPSGFTSTATAGADWGIVKWTPWGWLIKVLSEACGSCAEVLGQVAGSAGYGLGILGGLITNPTVLNPPSADYHPPRVVQPVADHASTQTQSEPNQNTGRQARCTNTGINWELGLCTYECDDGLPYATHIPAGNKCERFIYKNWGL
jgi:RHS repeat-associated protein